MTNLNVLNNISMTKKSPFVLMKNNLHKRLASLMLVLIFSAYSIHAFGVTTTWSRTTGDINVSTPANWDNGTPNTGDSAIFDGTSILNADWDISANNAITNLTISSAFTGTLTIDEDLTLSSSLTINNDTGILSLSETLSSPSIT